MVKEDILLEIDLPRQSPGFVASAAHAALVGYFRPGFPFFVHPGEIVDQHRQGCHLALDLVLDSRREVAIGAGDKIVGRLRPTIIIGPHKMTGFAEARSRRHLHGQKHQGGDHDQRNHHRHNKALPPFPPNETMQRNQVPF